MSKGESETATRLAIAALDRGQYEEAAGHLRGAGEFLAGVVLVRAVHLARPQHFISWTPDEPSESALQAVCLRSTQAQRDQARAFCESLGRSRSAAFLLGSVLDVALEERAEAVQYYRRACEEEDGDGGGGARDLAQCALGFCLALGVEGACGQDIAAAQSLLEASAAQGNAMAMSNLALICGRKGDDAKAEELCRHAAELGNPIAMCNLADVLARRGNDAGSVRLLEAAACRFRSARALNALGSRAETKGDLAHAEMLYSRASEQMHAKATFNLSRVKAMADDKQESWRLLCLAAAYGDEDAKKHLARIRAAAKSTPK
jgi:TPR repeat protein